MESISIDADGGGGVDSVELVAAVELEGVDITCVEITEVGVRVKDRDNAGSREALDANQVVSEARVVDGVGQRDRMPVA